MAKLTLQQKETLASTITPRHCQLCGSANWLVMDDLLELRPYSDEGAFVIGGSTVPVVAIACVNCKQIVLVSAVAHGFAK